jgi:hypothetical protein
METFAALKQMEGTLSLTCDRLNAMKAKLEDLLFRAQRIAAAMKATQKVTDTMFGYDLQKFRREVRTFSGEISGIPVVMGSIERGASPDEKAVKFAQSVMRLTMRLSQSLRAMHDMSILAHQHIRTADHKIEAWYLSQEVEEMVMRGQSLPTSANKIVIATAVPTASPPSQPPGSPPAKA